MLNDKVRVKTTIKVHGKVLKVWLVSNRHDTVHAITQEAIKCCQQFKLRLNIIKSVDVVINGLMAEQTMVIRDLLAQSMEAQIEIRCCRKKRGKGCPQLSEQHLKLVKATKDIDEYLKFNKQHRGKCSESFGVLRKYLMQAKGYRIEVSDLEKILYIVPRHYIISNFEGQTMLRMDSGKWRKQLFMSRLRKCVRKHGRKIPSLPLSADKIVLTKRQNFGNKLDGRQLLNKNRHPGHFQQKLLAIVKAKEQLLRNQDVPNGLSLL